MENDSMNLKIISDNDLIKIAHAIWPEISRKFQPSIKIINKYCVAKLSIGKKNNDQHVGYSYVSSVGCVHKLNGGCTMCGLETGRIIGTKIRIDELKKNYNRAIKYLLKINKGKSLYTYNFSTGGSFFDTTEVPLSVRKYVYKKIMQMHPRDKEAIISFETRLEYINIDILNEFKKCLGDNFKLSISYGLESINPLVRECCINKRLPDDYIEKIKLLLDHEVFIVNHIIIKPLFLTEKEAIDDVVNSVLTIFEKNLAHFVVVMTMGLRKYSIIAKLYSQNKYQLPSIWSTIAIIEKLGPDMCQYIYFNGFAYNFNQYNSNKYKGLVRGCSECSPLLIPKLLSFKRPTKKEWYELIDISQKINCKCKKEWLRRIKQLDPRTLKERIANGLNNLSIDTLGKDLKYFIKKNN